MAKQNKKASVKAAPFASFMGLRAETPEDDKDAKRAEQEEQWAKKAETDPDREQLEDESDDDYATRMESMDKDEAEGEIETKPDAEDEADDEKAKAVRQSERVRCARIIAHGIKSGNVNQAAVLAFDTGLSASQAITTMNASKVDQKVGGLGNRMTGVNTPNIGGGSTGTGKHFQNRDEATASSILDSVNAARS